MMWHIAGQGCCTSHCPFGRAMAASQLDKFVALGSVSYCSAHGSYLLRSWAFLVITDVAHKPSNQSMKPTSVKINTWRAAPLRDKLTHSLQLFRRSVFLSMSHRFLLAPFSVFATAPWISSRCPDFPSAIRLFAITHSRRKVVQR
jgi:hypothetical protein